MSVSELAERLGVGVAGGLGQPRQPGVPEAVLPVPAALAGLLPAGGLRRGSVLQVERSVALALALLGEASAAGAWCAVVGLPDIGVLAASELGLDPRRLALVPDPGPDWAVVVAALVDSADIVLLHPPSLLRGADLRRLTARIRERSAVLIVQGPWEGAEVRLRAAETRWHGLSSGHGRLHDYQLDVQSWGRGAAARPRRVQVLLPGISQVPPEPVSAAPERSVASDTSVAPDTSRAA